MLRFIVKLEAQNRLQNRGIVTVITVAHYVHCASRHHIALRQGVKVHVQPFFPPSLNINPENHHKNMTELKLLQTDWLF